MTAIDTSALKPVGRFAAKYGIILAFIAICMILAIAEDRFLSTRNIFNVLRQTSINGILAVGMTFVILTRGIDLSVGSVAALAGMVAGSLATMQTISMVFSEPLDPLLVVVIGTLVGMACGFVNGTIVARFAVPPFVVTLGMLSAARGLTLLYSDGRPIPNLDPGFRYIGTGEIFGVPVPALLFLAVFLIAWLVLTRTSYGRYVYAVGGNEKSARTSGINTKRIILSVYVIGGALAALGGMILAARTGSALPQAGVAYELDAIAAVVIGGTSLSGGVGSVVGTLFGALIIGVINNGLDLLGVESYYQQVIKGAIIVAAVMLDPSRRSRE